MSSPTRKPITNDDLKHLRNDLIEFWLLLEKNRDKRITQEFNSFKQELKEYVMAAERSRSRRIGQSLHLLGVDIKKFITQRLNTAVEIKPRRRLFRWLMD